MTIHTRINACGRVTLRQALVALSCGLALFIPLFMPNGLMSCAAAQEQDVPIAELKEKLQRETQELKRHIAELIETGRDDEAEATRQELAKFQQAMERQIREVRGKRSPATDQQARQERAEAAQKRRTEHQEKREAMEREAMKHMEAKQREAKQREAMQREPRTPRHESAPEPHVRELHEQLTQAIKQRQPERVLELSHLIANHLREQPMQERRQRERIEQDQSRDDRPRDGQPRHEQPRHEQPRHEQPRHEQPRHDGASPDFANEMRMMVQELRGELQQLRRQLEELRREHR
jgi:DNA repair exonuclease SbcCD ATPase subunit